MENMINKINEAISKYGMIAKEWKGKIAIIDKKNRFAGWIDEQKKLNIKYLGQQVLIGSIARNEINKVLSNIE